MKTNIKNTLIVLALLCSGILSAQIITGKVTDNLDVIPFANVILKDKTNKIVTGITTDENGAFELKTTSGNYSLEIIFLGYKTWKKTIKIDKNLHLGTIILEENTQALNEIIVKTEKRILERKIDRMIFNVAKSISATGGNGIDVLSITPGVQVINGALAILGKGATQVMINGRISPLQGDDLISFLSGFSASDILKIEVITNPPAKYDAAGNGGLINIILKKGLLDSWRNATTVSYNQNKYNFTTLANNFFYNKNKLSLSASINATKGNFEGLEGILINYPNNFWDIDIKGKNKKDQFSGRFLVDYTLSDKTTFGIQYLGNTKQPDIVGTTTSTIFDNQKNLQSSLINTGNREVKNKNHSINFHLNSDLDSLGKSISLDVDYFTYNSKISQDFRTESFDANYNSQGINAAALNLANQEIENFNTQIDLTFPLKKVKLSYGVKASFTNTKSNVFYYNTLSNNKILDPNRSNAFEYEENVLAAYFSGNTDLSDKLTLQFGLRFEDTKATGINAAIQQENQNNYSKFFPTLYLSYNKNELHNFGFAYGKRISRPNFRNLNPFRVYINDNSYSVGNPFLQPSFSDNFEVYHLYKNNLNTSFSLNITNDGFGAVFNTDAQNQDQIITRENYFKTSTYMFSEGFSYNKISWWKSQNNLSLMAFVTKFTKDIGTNPKNGTQLSISSNNTFSLSNNTKLQVNSWFGSKHSRGLYSVGNLYNLSFGLQHQFKNNVKFSIFCNDVFNTASLRNYVSNVNDIQQNYRSNESSRNIRISLSYDFGNKKVNVKNRAFSNNDEQRRSN
ncbi:TonB-dependent receptor domain-containing protein [Polaribacter sp. Asnod6-C07]|uniref:TonB-dependent receptor domain-containing protein n=1 Tax=Polaribacter sp. Asnod6-C07 TaxID=3160582 RepID=UPI003870782F